MCVIPVLNLNQARMQSWAHIDAHTDIYIYIYIVRHIRTKYLLRNIAWYLMFLQMSAWETM